MLSIRLGFILIATLAIAGCGRRGSLELPPGSPPSRAGAADVSQTSQVNPEIEQPGLIQSPDRTYQVPAATKMQLEQKAPKRPINAPPVERPSTFVLDPLL